MDTESASIRHRLKARFALTFGFAFLRNSLIPYTLPAIESLLYLGVARYFYARKKALPASGAASVRSVAVSGLLEIATIWDYGNINILARRRYEANLLEKRFGPATLVTSCFCVGKKNFEDLCELSIVHLALRYLSAPSSVKRISFGSNYMLSLKVVTGTKQKTEKRLVVWKSEFEKDLKCLPRRKPSNRDLDTPYSPWWLDPKVNFMPEDDFEAHFN
ncbi:uncharacterized protein RSE6_04087 [Rhynchosporium secalis]|uniref:Uncharacterized protein n=1 Tax=Rhynchosporium secalis TaxID=38038 RepID=A0A1E1M4D5_RHYSE|nr:uncharacterized protein RSE6_04087 [Rhynchosporium secalis]